MTDIASLGLEIDTRQVVDGKKALDQFGEASAQVEQKVKSNNGQMADTAKIMRAQAEQARATAAANMALGTSTDKMTIGAQLFIEKLQDQVAVLGMSRSQLAAYQAAQLGVSKEAEQSVAKLKAYEDQIKAAADAKAQAAAKANQLTDALGLLAKGYAALKVAEYIRDAALLSARYETLGIVSEVVGRNAGYTKTQMDYATDAIARQGITMIESRQSAIKLVQAHVDLTHATSLARIAQDAAVIGNINSSEAFDRLVNGISRGNVLILRNIGINVNLEAAYQNMAQSLGKTTGELTENERVQARVSAVMEHGTDIAGTYTAAMDTAGKQLKSMQRYTEDLKTVLGETFNEALTVGVMGLTAHLKDANGEVSELSKSGELKAWGESITNVLVSVADNANNAYQALKILGLTASMVASMGNTTPMYSTGRSAIMQAYKNDVADALATEDRFSKSLAEHRAASLVASKAAADAKLKVDQDYATKATAILLKSANEGAAAQETARKAVIALHHSIYVGTPTYRDSESKPQKPKVDQAESTAMADHIARLEAVAAAEKKHYADLSTLDDMYHKAGELSDQQFFANKRKYSEDAAAAQMTAYDKELGILRAHHSATAAEAARVAKQIGDIEDKKTAAKAANGAESFRLDEEERLRQAAIMSASDDAMNKYVANLNTEAQKLEDANRGHETSKAAVEREAVARLDLAIAYQQQFMADQAAAGTTAEELAQAPKILKYLQDVRAARERVALGLDQQQADQFATKAADQAIKDWQRAGQNISSSLTSAFGAGGKAIGEMFKAYAIGMEGQLRAQRDLAAAKKLADTDPQKVDAINRAQVAGAQAQVQSYADMAGAAQNYFAEGSRGYAAMGTAAKVLQAAEVALSLVKGVNAVLTQGEGDPYTAFGRMAAMAALVAGLGVALSGGGGGGVDDAKARQTAAGTGSVLGDSAAKSDSIARAVELTAANSSIELSHTAGMLASLRNIESSIAGLGNLIVRTTGITGMVAADTTPFGGSAIKGLGVAGGALGGAALGTYLGMGMAAIGGPLGLALGAVIGGVLGGTFIGKALGSVFGGGTSVTDTGLTVTSATLGGIATGGVKSSQYTDTTTKGGWFSSDKHNTSLTALGSQVDDQFSKIVLGLADSVKQSATILGAGGDEFTARLNGFVVDLGKISLKGLTGDEIQKQLESVFSKLGDDMAQRGVSGLQQFQKVGEGYFETLSRVAADYANLDSIMASVGTTFGARGVASIAAREHLIELTGGIDKLAQQTSSFSSNFLSEAEQLVPVQKYVTDQLAAMGLQGIDTRDKFKDVVLGLANSGALATEAGAKEYAALMALSDAFAKTHAATVDLTKSQQQIADERKSLQDQFDQLTMSSTQFLDKQRKALDASNRSLFDQVNAINSMKDAYSTESTALQANIDKNGAYLTSLRGLRDSLVLGNLSPLTPQQKYDEARRQYEQTVSAARTGDAAAQGNYRSVLNAFLTASQVTNASGAQYQADFAMTQRDLSDAIKWSAQQVDIGKASLNALNQQVSGLMTVNNSVLGVSASINTLAAVVSGYNAAKASGNQSDQIETLYRALLNRHSDPGGDAYWMNAINNGASLTDVATAFTQSPEYLALHGSHANGLDYVPFDGYRAELHRGETVLTAPEAVNYRSMGRMDMAPLVSEIKALRAEVASLRADQTTQTGALIASNLHANAAAADKVVNATVDAAAAAAWANKTTPKLA